MENRRILHENITHLELAPELITEANDISKPMSWKFKTKLQEAERNNGNGRVYRKPILEREANKFYEEKIKNKCSYGELDHPDTHVVSFKNACMTVEGLEWNGNELWGTIELLNTPSGEIIKNILKQGKRVGISSRCLGTTKQLSEGIVEVGDDLELIAWDLVTIPSTKNADFTNECITEGKGINEYKWNTVNNILNQLING